MNNEPMGSEEFTLEGQASMDVRILDQLSDIKKLCVEFAAKPLAENAQPLSEAWAAHLAAVRIALATIDKHDGTKKNAEELVRYAKGLEIHRIAFLNEISDSEDDEYDVSFLYDEILKGIADSVDCDDVGCDSCLSDDSLDQIYQLYAGSLQEDMTQFSEESIDIYGNLPTTKRKELMKKIGHHVADVAKVSFGVVIGIAVAKKSKLL